MKKNIIFSFLLATIVMVGCKKNDGALPEDLLVDRVPQPSVVINGGSPSIDLTNLASFQGKYDVKLLYPNDIPPAKLDIVIRKNNNNAVIKLVQAGVTAFPSSYTITAAQIAAFFSAPILLGDNYDIGVDIYTQSGNKYEAFPAVGAAYGSTGVANQPGFSPTIRYSAICAYDPNIYQGNFKVIDDAWQDFVPGDIVALTKIDATHFSWIDPFARNPIPVIVTVNTGNNTVSIAKQLIGTSWVYSTPATYPDPTVSASGTNNFVAPCDQTVTMNIQYGVNGIAGGIFGGGPYILIFKKQ